MVKVEFIRDYKCGYKKGCVKDVLPHFAYALIQAGVAKAIDEQGRNKMISKPPEKKHYYVG
jgi:hypothetical protein